MESQGDTILITLSESQNFFLENIKNIKAAKASVSAQIEYSFD